MSFVLPKDFAARKYAADTFEIAQPLMDKLNITYFGHSRLYRDGTITGLYSTIAVPSYWVQEQYAIPGANETGSLLKPGFYFADEMKELHNVNMLDDLAQNFSFHKIIYCVEKSEKYDDHFMFAGSSKLQVSAFFNTREWIEQFMSYYREKMCKALLSAEKTRVILPKTIPSLNIIETLCPSLVEDYDLLSFVIPSQIKLVNTNAKYILVTRKKFIYLSSLATGFSMNKIAERFQISRRTIESHVEQLKLQLLAHDKDQVLKLFWENLAANDKLFLYFRLITKFYSI